MSDPSGKPEVHPTMQRVLDSIIPGGKPSDVEQAEMFNALLREFEAAIIQRTIILHDDVTTDERQSARLAAAEDRVARDCDRLRQALSQSSRAEPSASTYYAVEEAVRDVCGPNGDGAERILHVVRVFAGNLRSGTVAPTVGHAAGYEWVPGAEPRSWCPRCGSCTCHSTADGDRQDPDYRCPLHGETSQHNASPEPASAGLAKAAFMEGWAAGHAGCSDGLPCRCDRNMEWDVSEIRRHLEEISYTPPPEEA
jgi:hypothetical protein